MEEIGQEIRRIQAPIKQNFLENLRSYINGQDINPNTKFTNSINTLYHKNKKPKFTKQFKEAVLGSYEANIDSLLAASKLNTYKNILEHVD